MAAKKTVTAQAADKISANGWVRLAEVRSDSSPDKWYKIGLRKTRRGDEFGCDCPGWRFAKNKDGSGKKPCKHVTRFLAGIIPTFNLRMTPAGLAILSARSAATAAAYKGVKLAAG